MKKILSISELQNSKWPQILMQTLQRNLISVFLHGDCLVEGFDALVSSWTISFILADNSCENLKPMQNLSAIAKKDNLAFCHFFTLKEIQTSADVFPLEFLHIANRNVTLCGKPPLPNFAPDFECLRLECERELRGLLVHLREAYIYLHNKKNQLHFFENANMALLPIMYGVYHLQYGAYPQNHSQIYKKYPTLTLPNTTKNETLFMQNVDNYINSITEITTFIDKMGIKN